jgi:hypothetical protein
MTVTPISCNQRESESVASAVARIVTDPWTIFIARWNWKSGLLSGGIRGLLYAVVLVRHPAGALHAAAVGTVLRVGMGGCWGSLIQALRDARPPWLAGLVTSLALPASAQALEFAFLKASGAHHIRSGMVASTVFSAASVAANFSLMRRGLLLTGEGTASLGSDFRRLPAVLGEGARSTVRGVRQALQKTK